MKTNLFSKGNVKHFFAHLSIFLIKVIILSVIIILTSCSFENLNVKYKSEFGRVKRSSSSIALTHDGETLFVVNPDSNSLTVVSTKNNSVEKEITVGHDPRTVAVSRNDVNVITANRESNDISVISVRTGKVIAEVFVGDLPWGVITNPKNNLVYVSCEGENYIAVVDLRKKAMIGSIPVEERPTGLAINQDGSILYVTHLLTGKISLIDTKEMQVVSTINTWPDSNLSQSIVLNEDTQLAYLPLTRSNEANPALTFDTTMFPIVTVLDLSTLNVIPKKTISLPEVDKAVGLPYDIALHPNSEILYVVNAASNDVSAVNLETNKVHAHIEVGDNPRGIVASTDGQYIYVNNTLSGSVSVVETENNKVIDEIYVTEIPLPPALLHGKQLFHSSDNKTMALDQWTSCNSCHWEGEHDGRTWIFNFAGPRNTTSLLGMIDTYPLRWSAEWDESADSEFAIQKEQFGKGFLGDSINETLGEPNSGRSYDLDCLAAFIDSLEYRPNSSEDENHSELIKQGEDIFYDPIVKCGECHPKPYYTDFNTHDVGTVVDIRERLGSEIDTPTLRSLFRSAPYLHDGSALSLFDLFAVNNSGDKHGVTSHLSEHELQALEAFLLTIQ